MTYVRMKGVAKPMKAGSFKDTVRKTVQLLVRDNIEVMFRGFQPMVLTQGGKIVRMVLPEVGDDAPEALIEAMAGFIDHECGHIFYTDFARAQELGDRKPLKACLLNIVEDIRLEKLLPRDLPGTKDNLERMYEKQIEIFWGTPIKKHLNAGATDDRMLSICLVVAFRALAGQKVFQRHMDDNNYWRFMTPLLSRMPTLGAELQGLETYDDVVRVTEAVLDALDAKTKQQMDDDAAQQQAQQQQDQDQDDDDDKPSSDCDGDGDAESDEPQEGDGDEGEGEEGDEGEGGDAGDDEGNSSEGDEADEGDGGDGDDDADAPDGEGDDDSEDDADSKSKGGKGKGDGEGEDDPDSDEEGGDCSGDDDQSNPNEDGAGDGDPGNGDDDYEDEDDDSEGSGGGKTNRTITDAVKSLEATQRKVLYLHKSKRRSVDRIAKQMNLSEDEVKATLRSARRALADFMTGDK